MNIRLIPSCHPLVCPSLSIGRTCPCLRHDTFPVSCIVVEHPEDDDVLLGHFCADDLNGLRGDVAHVVSYASGLHLLDLLHGVSPIGYLPEDAVAPAVAGLARKVKVGVVNGVDEELACCGLRISITKPSFSNFT